MSISHNAFQIETKQKLNWFKYDQFNLIYWNINSIKNKLFDIEEIANQKKNKLIHFIALTETRITDNDNDLFNIPNYRSFFSNRGDGYGGAALYIHESIDCNLIVSGVEHKVNYAVVNVPILKSSIAVVYKKPTVSMDKFLSVLNKVFDSASKIILIGDFNLNIQLSNNSITQYTTA